MTVKAPASPVGRVKEADVIVAALPVPVNDAAVPVYDTPDTEIPDPGMPVEPDGAQVMPEAAVDLGRVDKAPEDPIADEALEADATVEFPNGPVEAAEPEPPDPEAALEVLAGHEKMASNKSC